MKLRTIFCFQKSSCGTMEGSIYFYSYTKDEFKWRFKLAKPCNWHEMLLVVNLFFINMIQGCCCLMFIIYHLYSGMCINIMYIKHVWVNRIQNFFKTLWYNCFKYVEKLSEMGYLRWPWPPTLATRQSNWNDDHSFS